MSKLFGRTPSPSLVISVIALLLAASGSAVAASKLVSGDSLIKEHSLSGNRLQNHTLTATQINVSKLGTVPHAALADHATSATNAIDAIDATNAVNATNAANATNATNATTATTAGSAPISKVTYVTASAGLGTNPNAIIPVTATCPAGTHVIGGGASLSDESNTFVNDSYPNGEGAWTADYVSGGVSGDTGTTTAICAPAASTAP